MIAGLLLGAALAAGGVVDRVAAVVDGGVITLSDVYAIGSEYIDEACPPPLGDACIAEAETAVLDALIRRKLIEGELERLGMAVVAEDVDRAIDQIVRDNPGLGSRDGLRREVERSGIPWESYRTEIAEQVRLQRFQGLVLQSRISVRDEELRDRYQRRVRTLEKPVVVTLEGFGVALPADASPEERGSLLAQLAEVLAEVTSGARSWAEVQRTYDSAGMARLFQGASFRREDLNEKLASVAFRAEVGAIAQPVLQGNVAIVLRVMSREQIDAPAPPFEDVRDQLAEEVMMEKLEVAEAAWYDATRRTAAIRVLIGDADAG